MNWQVKQNIIVDNFTTMFLKEIHRNVYMKQKGLKKLEATIKSSSFTVHFE